MRLEDNASSKKLARIAGASYFISIVARIVADAVVRDRLVFANDAAKSSANILAHPTLFRIGFAADVVALTAFLVVTILLYVLLKPVQRPGSLLAAASGGLMIAAQSVSSVFHLLVLNILDGPSFLSASFSEPQLQALAMIALRVRSIAFHNIGLVFLGLYCVATGLLLFRSRLVPRIVAALFVFAGLAYLPFAWPPLPKLLLPQLLIPAAVGQIALTLWLLVFGVSTSRSGIEAGRAASPDAAPHHEPIAV